MIWILLLCGGVTLAYILYRVGVAYIILDALGSLFEVISDILCCWPDD